MQQMNGEEGMGRRRVNDMVKPRLRWEHVGFLFNKSEMAGSAWSDEKKCKYGLELIKVHFQFFDTSLWQDPKMRSNNLNIIACWYLTQIFTYFC